MIDSFLSATTTIAKATNADRDKYVRVYLRALDSKDKQNGLANQWYESMKTEDGMLIPRNGTEFILELLGVSIKEWEEALERVV